MKIVHVLDLIDEPKNGVATATKRNVKAQKAMGHEVIVVSTGEPAAGKVIAEELKIPIFQYLVDEQGFAFAKSDDSKFYEAFKDADIVHLHLPTPFCIRAGKIAQQMRIPTVASFHLAPQNITYTLGMGQFKPINERIYRQFEKRFYQNFNIIHCPSKMQAELLREHGYEAELRVISNGVDSIFRPLDIPKPREMEDEFSILMVGRLSREKRQDVLIEAAKLSRHRDRIRLYFAGQGPEHKHLEELSSDLPNRPSFKFYEQDKLLTLMNQTDLYVHAADIEIEGISCIEAISTGLVPVIGDAKLSATKEFALDEKSIFQAGNAADLARKIDYWIDHPEERAVYSKRYAEFGASLNLSQTSEALVELYKDAIQLQKEKGYPNLADLKRFHPEDEPTEGNFPTMGKLKQGLLAFGRLLLIPCRLILLLIAIIVIFVVYGLQICGRENLKQLDEESAVSVSNHILPLDCVMCWIALFPRTVRFTTLSTNFELPIAGQILRLFKTIPTPVDFRTARFFIKKVREELEGNNFVHFYPEGLLLRDYPELRDFENGAFHAATKADRPVLPLAIRKVERKRRIRRIITNQTCYVLMIGEPLEADPALKGKRQIDDLRNRSHEAVELLLDEELYLPERDFYAYDFARITTTIYVMKWLLDFLL